MANWQDDPVVKPQQSADWQNDPVATAKPSPQEQGYAAGQGDSAFAAGANQVLQQALPGDTTNNLEAAGGELRSMITPGDNSTFAQHLDYAKGRSAGEADSSRVASTIGGTLGGLTGLGAAGEMVNATGRAVPIVGKALAAVSPTKGAGMLSNALKSAVMNGAGTFALQKAKGVDTGLAAEEAGGAAIAGPVIGKAVEMAAPAVAGLAAKAAPTLQKLVPSFTFKGLSAEASQAWRELADSIDEKPETLEAAIDSHLKATGNMPATAQIVNYKTQGQLRALAEANPILGDAAIKAAEAGGMPLHDQLNGITGPLENLDTKAGLEQARKDRMTSALNEQNSTTGVKLRDEPLSDPNGVMKDPHVGVALHPDVTYNARINQQSPIMTRIAADQQTVGDAEEARYQLRQSAANHLAAGQSEPYKNFSSVAQKVEDLAGTQHPAYKDAMDQYRSDSRYANAFQHGVTGNAQNAVPPGATSLARDLSTPEGKMGFTHGNAIYRAAKSVENIAPSSVKPVEELPASHVAQGAMAAVTHGAASAFHAIRSLPNVRMSDGAAKIIADKLYDPASTGMVVANLRRYGASNQQLRQLGALVGGMAGQKILSAVNPGTGQ